MDMEIRKILETIDIDNKMLRLSEMHKMMLETTPNNAEQIIKQMNDMGKGHYVGQNWFENQPYYSLFEAYAHEILQGHDKAIDRATRAVYLFQMWKLEWNESVTHWFLGIVYRNNSLLGNAEEELKRALAILKRLSSSPIQDRNYENIKRCKAQGSIIQQVIDELKNPPSRAPTTHQELPVGNDFQYFETSMIIVHRPGVTDRLICDKLIHQIHRTNGTVIFPLYTSGGKFEDCSLLDKELILPRQVYRMKQESRNNDVKVLEALRDRLYIREAKETGFPIVIIVDTLQKWSEELETQIRYLIQEASFLKLSIWIHAPIFLVPADLLPTIGTVVIVQPSRSELKILEESFPSSKIEIESKRYSQGLFVYNKASGKGWQVIDYSR